MWASILASLAQQLATTTDAIVVSHLIAPDAISAVNVVMPIMSLCTSIGFLFGVGGSVLAAKAIGRRDMTEANRVFTSSLTATLLCAVPLSVVGCWQAAGIAAVLCPADSRIYPMTVSYLQTIMLGTTFQLASFTLQCFVKTDGNPKRVMMAVMLSTLINFVLDIVFIKVFHMGIAGSAWATNVSYLVALSVCLLHFRSPHCSLRWLSSTFHHLSSTLRLVMSNMVEGFPMCINGLLLGLCIFGFNRIVLHAQGADGMYIWSVCLQLFVLTQMVLAGIGSSIFSIGSMLVGERDMLGLDILVRRILTYVCGVLLVAILFVVTFPEVVGRMFGSGGINVGNRLHMALYIFSMMLIPYAIVAIMRTLYQIIGYRTMSVVFSVAQLIVMVLFVWAFSLIRPEWLWWGYPVSAIFLLLSMFLFSWYKHHKQPDAALMTLIPQTTKGKALNFSIRLTRDDITHALNDIAAFLKECGVVGSTAFSVHLCCEELLYNIVGHAVGKHIGKHFVDVHIRCTEQQISVLLKDDGRPFNPVLKETPTGVEHLSLRLVNGWSSTINYKYMYDQNMVFLTFCIIATDA